MLSVGGFQFSMGILLVLLSATVFTVFPPHAAGDQSAAFLSDVPSVEGKGSVSPGAPLVATSAAISTPLPLTSILGDPPAAIFTPLRDPLAANSSTLGDPSAAAAAPVGVDIGEGDGDEQFQARVRDLPIDIQGPSTLGDPPAASLSTLGDPPAAIFTPFRDPLAANSSTLGDPSAAAAAPVGVNTGEGDGDEQFQARVRALPIDIQGLIATRVMREQASNMSSNFNRLSDIGLSMTDNAYQNDGSGPIFGRPSLRPHMVRQTFDDIPQNAEESLEILRDMMAKILLIRGLIHLVHPLNVENPPPVPYFEEDEIEEENDDYLENEIEEESDDYSNVIGAAGAVIQSDGTFLAKETDNLARELTRFQISPPERQSELMESMVIRLIHMLIFIGNTVNLAADAQARSYAWQQHQREQDDEYPEEQDDDPEEQDDEYPEEQENQYPEE